MTLDSLTKYHPLKNYNPLKKYLLQVSKFLCFLMVKELLLYNIIVLIVEACCFNEIAYLGYFIFRLYFA